MRVIFIFLSFVAPLIISAQASIFNTALISQIADKNNIDQEYSLLVKGNILKLQQNQQQFHYKLLYHSGDIASILCSPAHLSQLIENKLISYAEFIAPRKMVLNDTMLKRNRILAAKNGELPLTQAYDGTGVIMGIIDSGIDFNHPDFKDSLGNTRIKYIWDQKPTSGSTVPALFNYGIEWTEAQINANQCTHTDAALFGHGTHVAGIAAGNGLATKSHYGVASNADIIVVALDFAKSGPTIADAVKYIFDKAIQLGKPCVINASLGDYYGSHDATDLEAKMIEGLLLSSAGQAIVAAAGNAGKIAHHVKTQTSATDTAFTWIKNNNATKYYWAYADTTQMKNLKITVGANRANFVELGNTGYKTYSYALNIQKTDTLKNNGNRLGIVKTIASVNPSGVYELFITINADSTNLLWKVETTGPGLHHSWNFDFVRSPLPSLAQLPAISKYIKPDTLYSMVSGFQCSDEIITVANYQNSQFYYDVKDSLQNTQVAAGTISANSSLGPTRDGRQKPDIAASGDAIFSAVVLSLIPAYISNSPQKISKDSMHVGGGGTSASSPVVAGVAALYFQKNPYGTHRDLKQAIINCAYTDNFTGTALPDYQWGHGKIDGKNTLLCGENLVAIKSIEKRNEAFCYPSPFSEKLFIAMPDKGNQKTIAIYNTDGKLLYENKFTENSFELNASSINASGLLLIKVSNTEKIYYFKAIKE